MPVDRYDILTRLRQVADLAASLSLTFAACVVVVVVLKPSLARISAKTPHVTESVPKEPVSLKGAELEGRADASVVLIEYADFQCPYCSKFANETLPELRKRYIDSGKVLLAFRHFPLENIHPFALVAARAAACAGMQGRFWQMHDALFAIHQKLDETVIQERAEKIGFARAKLAACPTARLEGDIREDIATGEAVGISGTPAFLIGRLGADRTVSVTERLKGAQAISAFATAFDRLLQPRK